MLNFIVLAGGSGTRLFPISRENYPKQFIKLDKKDLSLFQQTINRLLHFSQQSQISSTIWIITNEKYKFYIQNQLDELYELSKAQIKKEAIITLFEPKGKNTAPAIALALRKALEAGKGEEELFFVFPSDHLINPQEAFTSDVSEAIKFASQGFIVTFGIRPTHPETGYGYIKVYKPISERAFKVASFVEKPSREVAERYLREGCYFWNSGIFAFSGKTILEELKIHAPSLAQLISVSENELDSYFLDKVPEISIDYAVMEKSKSMVLIPASFTWSDVGSWDSVYEVMPKDEAGLVSSGNVLAYSCKNSLLLGNERLVVAVGLEDLILIETPDVVLIMKRGESQRVKEVVQKLKVEGSSLVREHLTEYRPWGSFTLLERGGRYKIKRITVKPGEALSLQMHHHRSEHWVVVKGTANVQIGEKTLFVHENESVFIPKSTLHRLENPGKVPLEIIEVQVGEYVEEDDIVRFSDQYGRA